MLSQDGNAAGMHPHSRAERSRSPGSTTHRPDQSLGVFVELKNSQSSFTFTEACFGALGGAAYGMAGPVIGHPLDTVKTKMQGEKAFRSQSATAVVRSIVKSDGLSGFYRGIFPTLAGSAIFGGLVLGSFKGSKAACCGTVLEDRIPCSGGLQGSVLLGGLVASVVRSSLETPLALMKVRQQVGLSWMLDGPSHRVRILDYWRGFGPTFFRCWGMLGTFFVTVDYAERLAPELVATPLVGPFVKGGVCACAGWAVAWPMETVKSRVQADAHGEVKGGTFKLMRDILRTEGTRGLYRGLGLGLSKSFMSNGVAMIALEVINSARAESC